MTDKDVPGDGTVTSPPLHHKESPFFAADRAAYWRHLRELGPVVKIDTGDPWLLSRPPGRRASGVARSANLYVAAENLCDSLVRRAPPTGATLLRYARGACPFRQRVASALQPQSAGPLRWGLAFQGSETGRQGRGQKAV